MLPRLVASLSDIDAISISFNLQVVIPPQKLTPESFPSAESDSPFAATENGIPELPKFSTGTALWPSHCNSTPNPHICGGQDRPSAWSKQTASPSRTTKNTRQITQIRMPPQIFRQNLLPRSNPPPLISARARMEPSVKSQ